MWNKWGWESEVGRTEGRWEMVEERGPNRNYNFQLSLPFFFGLCPFSRKIHFFPLFFFFVFMGHSCALENLDEVLCMLVVKIVKIASQLANSYEFVSWLRKPGWTGRKIKPGQTRSNSGWLVKSDRIDPILRSRIFIILKPNFALIYLINSYIYT